MRNICRCAGLIGTTALLCGVGDLPGTARAQIDPSTAQTPAGQTESAQPGAAPPLAAKLDEVVVTSSKLEESVSRATTAVTVLTQEDIERRQTTDVFEQLREVPGLHVTQNGSRGAAASLFTRGGESDYNLVLIDGVKANLGGGAFDFSDVTTLGVNRIEVVRGAHTALYGSDAMSSVIQLLTPRGLGPPRATLRFRGGTHDTFEEQFSMSGGTPRYGYNFAVERVDSAGILPKNSDYANTTLASRFDLVPAESLELTTTVRYIDSRFHFPTGSSGDRFDIPDPRQYTERRRLILGPRAVYRPTSWWRHRLQLGLLHEWLGFRDPDDGAMIDPFGSFVSHTAERRLSVDYSSDFFLPRVLHVVPTLTLGGYVEDEHFDQKTRSLSVFGELRSRVRPSRNAQAFYSQLQLAWREMVFITSGFRLDDGSTYGTHVHPRVSAALIIPRLDTKLRGGYSEGLKAPNFIDNFGPFGGNRDLEPEQSTSWEIGLAQPLELAGFAGELDLTYFSTEYTNMIAYVSRGFLDSSLLNVQRARSRGIEFGARAFMSHGFSARGSYTYLETRVLDSGGVGAPVFVQGKSLIRRPEHVGSLTLHYVCGRLNANLHVFLKGRATDVDFTPVWPAPARRVRLRGYTRADVAVSYLLFEEQWGIRALTLEGQAKNLFDEDYEETWGFSAAGASFLAGFRAEF